MRSRSIWRGATVVALTAVVAGCSGTRPSTADAVPALGTVAVITSVGQIARPTDVYLPTLAQDNEIIKAMNVVQAACMRGFGLPDNPYEVLGLDAVFATRTSVSDEYGYFGTGNALDQGYDRVTDQAPARTNRPALPAASLAVLTGKNRAGAPVTSYLGRTVPAGGCAMYAQDAVGGPLPQPDISTLPDGGPQIPPTDPRLVAADARWSACMAAKGFSYPTPIAAFLDPKWVPQSEAQFQDYTVTPAQIATATADLACKKSTNLVGVAVAVETAYDKQYIAAHAAALARFENQLHDRVAKAERIVAGQPA